MPTDRLRSGGQRASMAEYMELYRKMEEKIAGCREKFERDSAMLIGA